MRTRAGLCASVPCGWLWLERVPPCYVSPLAYVLRPGRLERFPDWTEPTLNWDEASLQMLGPTHWEAPISRGWAARCRHRVRSRAIEWRISGAGEFMNILIGLVVALAAVGFGVYAIIIY